jgi:hypothetical protein
MTNVSRIGLVKKLAVLFALGMSIAYLSKPEALRADTQCLDQCSSEFSACIKNCKENKSCISGCTSQDESCVMCCLYCS